MDKPVNASITASLKVGDLLKPHVKALILGVIASLGAGVANLLEPWPLKIVLDNVLRPRPIHGWLNRLILSTAGHDNLSILKFAALAVVWRKRRR